MNCTYIVSINTPSTKEIYNARAIQGTFRNCTSLVTVHFGANSIQSSVQFSQSNLLDTESIQNIIDALADFTGGTSKTLTFHSDVSAQVTAEQMAQAAAKNWTIK
jgi:hypothetical protein